MHLHDNGNSQPASAETEFQLPKNHEFVKSLDLWNIPFHVDLIDLPGAVPFYFVQKGFQRCKVACSYNFDISVDEIPNIPGHRKVVR